MVDSPSLDMTNLLMKEVDTILATGGPGMVRAAYSSGKPAIGVGVCTGMRTDYTAVTRF